MNAFLSFKVYVINYKNLDRRKSIITLLNHLGISEGDIHFAEEIDGSLIDRKRLVTDYNYTIRYAGKVSSGYTGNTLSHISILKDMIRNNVKQAIVFEDDIIEVYEGKTIDLFYAVYSQLPDYWEVVYLERCDSDCFNDIPFSGNLF